MILANLIGLTSINGGLFYIDAQKLCHGDIARYGKSCIVDFGIIHQYCLIFGFSLDEHVESSRSFEVLGGQSVVQRVISAS
jgi:hypothetical protein